MKRKRYSDEQIAFALRQTENGTLVEEVCRKLGVSEATLHGLLSSVPQFSLIMGFENSLVGIACQRSAGARPGRTLSRDRRTLPLEGGGLPPRGDPGRMLV